MTALPGNQQKADLILHGGKVLTVDANDSVQQAVAISGNTLHAVGSDHDVMGLAGRDTTLIDLQGRTLIPGIIDIHAHMDREGLKRLHPSLEGARSIDDILAVVKHQVAQKRPGEWVVTMPVGDPPNYADMPGNLLEGRFPTRWELDQVAPNNPVYIRGIWTPCNVPPSVSIANSMALQLAGIDRQTLTPDSSVTIERDSGAEPNGIFIDSARFPSVEFTLMKVVPRFTHADRVNALRESMKLYNSVGTTGTYEGHGVAPEVLRVYKELWDAGRMTVRARLVMSPAWQSVSEAAREMERWAHASSGPGFGDDMLNISGYYIQYGGSRYTARARAAELPYTGWAGFSPGYNPLSQFRQLVRLAAKYNLRVNTLVRDTLDEVLQVFQEVEQEFAISDNRWMIGHVRETRPEQLDRISRLGLVVETIPLTELWLRGGEYLESDDLANTVAAHRDYLEHSVNFGFGTDNKPYSPFETLWSAVARQERKTGKILGPGQRLTRQEALRVFTQSGAYFSFEEHRRGSLEPGKLADLAVLSHDLMSVPEEEIPLIDSLLTIVGGEVVHRSGGL